MIFFSRLPSLAAVVAVAALVAGCERPPVDSVQRGYRGTGMLEVYNPRIMAKDAPNHEAPAALPPVEAGGPTAGETYQNVKVLGNLSVGEFTRTMVALTAWVSPKQGCNYCHNPQNLADDSIYTKVVARRMIEMTQTINTKWKDHVANTGVTCYTCHRGEPVPKNIWFTAKPSRQSGAEGFLGDDAGQNSGERTMAGSSLPYDPYTPFLLDKQQIRVYSDTALPTGNRQSIKQAEHTYSLMMHFSKSLNVNCTYCHNSQSFGSWQGPPQRVTAWHGIRMVRDVNNDYVVPLTKEFPAERLGELGDVAKVNCATCHNGAYKPLYGVSMAKDYPAFTATHAAAMESALSTINGGTVFFGVGSAQIPADAIKGLNTLVEALKAKPDAMVAISGFHSAAGDLASNQELAKNRAFAVRDALRGAGVPEAQVVLDKPMQAEANLVGEDPKARRVELVVK